MSTAKKKAKPAARDVDVLARQLDRLDAMVTTSLQEHGRLRRALEETVQRADAAAFERIQKLEEKVSALTAQAVEREAQGRSLEARVEQLLQDLAQLAAKAGAADGVLLARTDNVVTELTDLSRRVSALERRLHDHEQLSPAEQS